MIKTIILGRYLLKMYSMHDRITWIIIYSQLFAMNVSDMY